MSKWWILQTCPQNAATEGWSQQRTNTATLWDEDYEEGNERKLRCRCKVNLWNDLKTRKQAFRHRAKTRTLFTFHAVAAPKSTIAGKQDLKNTSQRILSKTIQAKARHPPFGLRWWPWGEVWSFYRRWEYVLRLKRGRLIHQGFLIIEIP